MCGTLVCCLFGYPQFVDGLGDLESRGLVLKYLPRHLRTLSVLVLRTLCMGVDKSRDLGRGELRGSAANCDTLLVQSGKHFPQQQKKKTIATSGGTHF